MDLTPFLDSLGDANLDTVLLSVAVEGRVALAMKGRFLLRAVCSGFSDRQRIGCAVTDEAAALAYLEREPYELLICTDHLESGNGYDLTIGAPVSAGAGGTQNLTVNAGGHFTSTSAGTLTATGSIALKTYWDGTNLKNLTLGANVTAGSRLRRRRS